MRLLVLGGTMFLSRATAAAAVARGHDVVCASRGESGPLPDGVRFVRYDRTVDDPPVAEVGPVDAVVDVARHPSRVRTAVAAWPDAHWVFVSTVNVYPDSTERGRTPATAPLHEPLHEDVPLDGDPLAYGRMKVGCEQAVRAGAASATVVRPGLIVGPEDPTCRFGYWPERLAGTGPDDEVLAGGAPDDVVQVIDVRDLAAWLVDLAEARTVGDFDGVGPVTAIGDLLAQVAQGVGADPRLTWVPSEVLEEQRVAPWMGPRALPLWLPRPEHDGMMSHDPAPSLAAGLATRPVAETARDTLAWLREHPEAPREALTRDEEAAVLAAWGGTASSVTGPA